MSAPSGPRGSISRPRSSHSDPPHPLQGAATRVRSARHARISMSIALWRITRWPFGPLAAINPALTRTGLAAPGWGESWLEDEMAVPKRKTSPMKRGFRRSADALAAPTYVEDKDSGELRRPHHVDLKTGMYRGRQILKPKGEIV